MKANRVNLGKNNRIFIVIIQENNTCFLLTDTQEYTNL